MSERRTGSRRNTVADTTMTVNELLDKAERTDDVNWLREGVRMLAQALTGGRGDPADWRGTRRARPRSAHRAARAATGCGGGTPARGRSSWRSRRCAAGRATSRRWWRRGGAPSGRCVRCWPSAMWRACRPARSRTSRPRWGWRACHAARSAGSLLTSTSSSRRGAPARWTPAPIRCCGSTRSA